MADERDKTALGENDEGGRGRRGPQETRRPGRRGHDVEVGKTTVGETDEDDDVEAHKYTVGKTPIGKTSIG